MAVCNNIDFIFDNECIGESLPKINKNFERLDTGLCGLGQNFQTLDQYVKSLNAINSSTINLFFKGTTTEYLLSADVKDNSIGTDKLGQDIPQTTKAFLTDAKLSSLTDVNINSVVTGQILAWSGNAWVNKTLIDEVGAKTLNGLNDVTVTPPVNGEILRYNGGQWFNSPEDKELFVRDKDYGDIIVSGNGQTWNIKPNAVTTDKITDNAVTTPKIANLQITGNKIVNGTITPEKLSFPAGQTNTGINIGNGANIYTGANEGTRLPFKTLRGEGAVSIINGTDTVTIRVPNTAEPTLVNGTNIGFGEGKIVSNQSTSGNLRFKSLRAGTGISITQNDSEITISSAPATLGLSIVGVNNTSGQLTQSEVGTRIAAVYPPSQFPSGSICRVELTVPNITPIQTVTVSVPFSISYRWNGNANNVGNSFLLLSPPVTQGTGPDVNIYSGSQTYQGTATLSNQPALRVPTRQIWLYTLQGNFWTFTSQS